MNLTISGHHLDVTPALREYVLSKLDRVTRHFDQVVDISVLLTVEKLKEKERRQKAEVTLHVKGKDIFVEQSHDAPDDEPVSLLIFLLVPEAATQRHLEILSEIAEMLSDRGLRERLKLAEDASALHKLIADWAPLKSAA